MARAAFPRLLVECREASPPGAIAQQINLIMKTKLTMVEFSLIYFGEAKGKALGALASARCAPGSMRRFWIAEARSHAAIARRWWDSANLYRRMGV